MPRILFVSQEKGGVGKSLITRALAEAVPAAPILEIDSARRLVELEDRVTFFPMRAERKEIEKTGGQAARSEFDGVINAIGAASDPTIIDVGANTSRTLFFVLAELADDLKAGGIEAGIVVIVTAEPGALAEAPRLLTIARPWATCFVLENRLRGSVDPADLKRIADGAPVSHLEEQVMEEEAVRILQAGGLASIPNLDPAKLNQLHGLATGSRIRRDLTRMRLEAMQAVRKPAEWVIGGK